MSATSDVVTNVSSTRSSGELSPQRLAAAQHEVGQRRADVVAAQ